jgi:hypothetical protein
MKKFFPKHSHAQAAMEFLMTYGWAILAAVIAIGVLAYFGVFSPGKYTSESCILNPPFGCEETSIVNYPTYTQINLVIRNGLGEDAILPRMGSTISGCSGTWPSLPPWIPTLKIKNGDKVTASFSCNPPLASGKFKGDIKITYKKGVDGVLNNNAEGTLVKKVP